MIRANEMSLYSYLMGQALSNSALVTGYAPEWQLIAWFGRDKTGITSAMIARAQAEMYVKEFMKVCD